MKYFTVTLACTGAAIVVSPIAEADVRLTERVSMEGTGMMSLAAMSGSTTTSISGTSARIDNDITMQSRLARMVARDAGKTSEVVRLNDDVVLEIETPKKRYRQTSVSARRAQLEQAAQQLRQAQAQQPMGAGLDDSQCDWSPPKASVKKNGAQATFAGISAQETSVTLRQACKLRTTGAVCEVGMVSNLWLAPDFPGAVEARAFRNAYAEKLGLAAGGGAFGQQAQSMLGRYPAMWRQLAEELGKVKGHALKTTFTLEMEGAGCGTSSGQGGGGADANAAADVATQVIGGLFGRRQPQAAEASASAATPAGSTPGAQVVLRLTSEVTSIESAPLAAETFQAPAGFKQAGS
jgi:hypothetical protein